MVLYGLFMSNTNTAADLHAIIIALEAGDGCPVERATDNRAIHDLLAACEDADLDDEAQVAALVADARERLAVVEVAS